MFELIEKALISTCVEETLEKTREAFNSVECANFMAKNELRTILPIDKVSFPAKPICVHPLDLPRRRLGSEAGKRSFIHAIAHIEFNAIKLALDIAYRFKGLPEQFYIDWLYVANDECKHFEMLCRRLENYDCAYGDIPSHDGLWSMAVKTENDLLARLSLVPRYLEARGLDVTPGMLKKLTAQNDTASAAILEIILEDEVTHVEYGTKWLDYVCAENGLQRENVFFENIEHYLKGQILGPFNRPLRIRAGFTENELAELERLDKRSSR
ncbi:MAG: hypothetical protein COB22_06080 [Cycloclasticus sp.]|nr:MAG: hypothetical protein COB22_06080 [Cycloclasticus sp.]